MIVLETVRTLVELRLYVVVVMLGNGYEALLEITLVVYETDIDVDIVPLEPELYEGTGVAGIVEAVID